MTDLAQRTGPGVLAAAMLGVGALLAGAGCAGPRPPAGPMLSVEGAPPVWPAPPAVPRYALAGVLIGEANFLPAGGSPRSTAETIFNAVVGLVVGAGPRDELRRPSAGMVRSDGSVLVVDAGLHGVAVFDRTQERFAVWTDAGNGTGFDHPVAIAGDGQGGYLVTDAGNARVIRLDAGGQPRGSFGAGILIRPTGIAVDAVAGRIYVADTPAHDIKIFDTAGTLIDTLGAPGRRLGRFNSPTHLAFAGDLLWVADTLNFRIQAFDRAGQVVTDFGELGLFVGNLARPKGVAVGGGGRIYVIESYYDHLLVFTPEGRLLLPIGGTGHETGKFYLPSGVWTDGAGRVYVADMFNGRVVVFSELTGLEGAG